MSDILADFSPASLEWGIKANLCAFFKELGRSPATAFVEDGPLVSWHTSIPHSWFNGVLTSTPAPHDADRLIAGRLAYFQERGVGAVSWWLEPQVDAAGWEPHLLRAGFVVDDHTPGMATDLSKLRAAAEPPEGLEILPVQDAGTLQDWIEPFVSGFGLPATLAGDMAELFAGLGLGLPLRHYLGYLDGEPVATSTLYLGAGVAGIYNVATRAEARGRGIGTALTLAPLRDAQALGYKVGVLQSSEKGFPVYLRLGFEHLCAISYYKWPQGA